MEASGAAASGESQAHILRSWEVSDIDIQTLESHAGPRLRQLGVSVCRRDIFEICESEPELVRAPCIAVMACICPPSAHRADLDALLTQYIGHKPDHVERRHLFEGMCFEAVLGQLPHAVAVSINRRSDATRASGSPALVANLKAVEGYQPKQCQWAQGEPIRTLHGGTDLVARISTTGVVDPVQFIGTDMQFDLIKMITLATRCGWRILFVGDGNGSLACGCGSQVAATLRGCPISPVMVHLESTPLVMKTLGRETGSYVTFRTYAKDYQIKKIMEQWLHRYNDDPATAWSQMVAGTDGLLQPRVNLNAGVMWLFATFA